MCFNAIGITRKLISYAKHRLQDETMVRKLEQKLKYLENLPEANYMMSGFSHPELLSFTNTKPFEPQLLKWGLIPSWIKDNEAAKKIMRSTLNARRETIFEKPSFRKAARDQRCIIYIDAFYEHHHQDGKKYPFHISTKNSEPMAIAGLWEEWRNAKSGQTIKTASIITTSANELMSKIHNNPKLKESRMPVILPKNLQDDWLKPINNEQDKQSIQELLRCIDSNLLKAHTVRKLTGKNSVGNCEEAEEEFLYEELKLVV